MCLCGEPKSEHYDEVDPPLFPTGAVDICGNRSWCGCEGFEEDEDAGTTDRPTLDSGLRRVVTDADVDRGAERLAEQGTRLERETQELLAKTEELKRNCKRLFVRIIHAWEARN